MTMRTDPHRFGTVVLFGGAGFIGSHFARMLDMHDLANEIIIADINAPAAEHGARSRYVEVDVRQPIPVDLSPGAPDLLVNLAAVHREPGHEPHEYFSTNVNGAKHVCAYAAKVGCQSLIFTSSISVYGPSEAQKDERAEPTPTSAYGASKLVAEHIHLGWYQESRSDRRLLIVRPGVVFGPGEGGNVTRLVRAVSARRFLYCGNQNVRKAGGYVKELCDVMLWALGHVTKQDVGALTLNFSMDPTPTLREFVEAIAAVAAVPVPRISVPFLPLLGASYAAELASRMLGISQPLHPTRAKKLVRSNNIISGVLKELGYRRMYSLDAALRDWRQSSSADWD
jgi:nucleoside-diphosphate-sugar epimerase